MFYKSYQRRILFFVECSIWNKREKKKKEEQGDFHILQQEQKEELTKGIPFIYKASDLMMSQALDIGYDKALK